MRRVEERCIFAGPAHGRHEWKFERDLIYVCPGDSFWDRLRDGFRYLWRGAPW
jgi:hypothetical protein